MGPLSQLLTATNMTSQSTAKTTKAIILNTRIMVSQRLPLPPKLQGHWPAPDWLPTGEGKEPLYGLPGGRKWPTDESVTRNPGNPSQ
jgi:hypothetical protein